MIYDVTNTKSIIKTIEKILRKLLVKLSQKSKYGQVMIMEDMLEEILEKKQIILYSIEKRSLLSQFQRFQIKNMLEKLYLINYGYFKW